MTTVKWTDTSGPKPKEKQGDIQQYIVVNNQVCAIIFTTMAIEVVSVDKLSFP